MHRRGFLGGLIALAGPAIVRTPGILMPVRRIPSVSRLPSVAFVVTGIDAWGKTVTEVIRPRIQEDPRISLTDHSFREITAWAFGGVAG